MAKERTQRLNSLLQQVISEVIQTEIKNPHLPAFIAVTGVDITKDLKSAKVFISVIGTAEQKAKAVEILQGASHFISARASKEVVMRFFPELTFYIDDTVEKQSHIEEILMKIHKEEESRKSHDG